MYFVYEKRIAYQKSVELMASVAVYRSQDALGD